LIRGCPTSSCCDWEVNTNTDYDYTLDIDGPLFRRQRELLLRLNEVVRYGRAYERHDGDEVLMEGLLELTDAVADQAHDRHGIDCLLCPDDPDTAP
jgi:hypothetical protein